jgi:hypothetical protein
MKKNTFMPADRAGDRTRAAVLRWAAALPADRYLIAAIPAEAEALVHRRLLTIEELDRALGWLRWLNSNNHHIVGRPWDARHVLVDDLSPVALEAMLGRHQPAAIVESSPQNFQAWVTVTAAPVLPAVAGVAARLLAARHGGDRGAASPCQPGRICGFTNRKPHCRLGSGLFPFAVLRHADGPVVDPAGAEVLAVAAQLAAEPPPRRASQIGTYALGKSGRQLIRRDAAAEHAAAISHIAATLPPGAVLDRSRADHAAARRLLARGMSVAETVGVVLAGERARGMPATSAAAYAKRTVEAALAALGRRPAP